MCIFCGGQCGGAGEFLISMGLPLLALYLYKMKGFLLRMKDKLLGRPSPAGNLPGQAGTCDCCGEPASNCPHSLSPGLSALPVEQLTELAIEPAPKNNPAKTAKRTLEGVGGWLLLLCFNLVVLVPAFSLYQVNCDLDLLIRPQMRILLSVWSKSYYYFSVVNLFVMLFLALYSFYSGLRLWQIKAGAVRTAKTFLVVQLSLTLVMLALHQIILSQSGGRNVAAATMGQSISALLFFFIWYAYLMKSRRVNQTYDQHDEGLMVPSAAS